MKRTLLDLYGAGILFFYYIKIPFAIGLPILYFELDYNDNFILDIIWVFCLVLVVQDIFKLIKTRGCNNE